jgi:hypothetical protein
VGHASSSLGKRNDRPDRLRSARSLVAGFATGSPRASLNVLISERPAPPAAHSLHMDRGFSCGGKKRQGPSTPQERPHPFPRVPPARSQDGADRVARNAGESQSSGAGVSRQSRATCDFQGGKAVRRRRRSTSVVSVYCRPPFVVAGRPSRLRGGLLYSAAWVVPSRIVRDNHAPAHPDLAFAAPFNPEVP